MKTKITELLGIKYPVIQGGMAWTSDANLAAQALLLPAAVPPNGPKQKFKNAKP